MSEFALIRQLLAELPGLREDVLLGPGDDAALLKPPPGNALAVTTDTLVQGRHFPENADAAAVGWKSVMVNLSDLAAMGAEPAWITMTLSLPEADNSYLAGFMRGVGAALALHSVSLVGGDLTRGPFVINVNAMGFVPEGRAMRRDGARPGDLVCVTGSLGDAALGLRLWQSPQGAAPACDPAHRDFLLGRLHRPSARVTEGLHLRSAVHAAADISDGLAADLGHILDASGVGARLEAERLPASAAFTAVCPKQEALGFQIAGGDDYELCVCLPEAAFGELAASLACGLTAVGRIERQPGLRIVDARGSKLSLENAGFDHFALF